MALARNDVMWFRGWLLDCGYICSFFPCLCIYVHIAIERAYAYGIVAAKVGHYKAGTLYWVRNAAVSAIEDREHLHDMTKMS